MTLTVSGENLDLEEALRQPIPEKVEPTVAGAFGGSLNSHVAMTREASSLLWLGRNPEKLESASAAATWMSWSGGRAGENGPNTFDPAVVAENLPIAKLALTGAPVDVPACRQRRQTLSAGGAIARSGWLDPQASREPPGAA
jgi:hypothetical protein